ncbi:20943_t:CDS:2, partial [Cetraspora pellucida]
LIKEHEIEPVTYTPKETISTTVYMLYSSGTTGKQKGVEITHRNLVASLVQFREFEKDISSHSILMGVMPFSHVYALICVVHIALIRGATTVILPNFDVKTFCSCIQKYKLNYIHATPPIILTLVKDPIAKTYDLSSVKVIVSAAAPLGNELERVFFNIFNIPIKQAYGKNNNNKQVDYRLTEITISHYSDSNNMVSGSCGLLMPNMSAKILSNDGHELGPNNPGELCIRGPTAMKGYLKNKDATDAIFDKDGFLHTGDIAYVDNQGNYFIVDRKKELIKHNGIHVAPAELEEILLTHPKILDAAVIGYYSEQCQNEFPVAYIVTKLEKNQSLKNEILNYVN